MADTYPNPFVSSSPLGDALKNIGRVIMSGPTDAQKIIFAEEALKRQRARTGADSISGMFRQFGQPGFDRNAVMADAVTSGYDPKNLAELERYGSANTFGYQDPRTTNAYVGAGGPFAGTPAGFAISQNNEMEKARMKPQAVGGPNGAEYVRTDQSYGRPAVENLGQVQAGEARRALAQPGGIEAAPAATQRFIGAETKANPKPLNYLSPTGTRHVTYDGKTDAQNGQPLPPGGSIAEVTGTPEQAGLRPTVQGDLQKQDIAQQRFRALLGHTRSLAQADPKNFGVSGTIKGWSQDAAQLAANVSQGLGYGQVAEAIKDVQQRAIRSGVNPTLISGIFDRNLPALHTASDLLVYSAAEALANQSGRSVSDKDVKMFREIAGDPREWLGSQEKYLSKLDTMEQILSINQDVTNQNLRRQPTPAAPAAPGAGTTPPPSTAPGAPQVTEEVWVRGPDGRPQRVR